MSRIAATILITVILSAPICGWCGDLQAALGAAASSSGGAQEVGILTTEVLPGNGSRAGYVLGHGNVVPGSEWVSIGTRHAKRNEDYTIDYASGTLFFSEPVSQRESIKVDYRYVKTSGERTVTAPAALGFTFGNGALLNLTYAYRAADPERGQGYPDILTYGFNSTTPLGGSGTLKSLMYVASPQNANRLSLTANPAAKTKSKVKQDKLILQDADLGLGKVRLKLGFQEVGADFEGFASLRESNAAEAEVLNQLEKEKGIRRMNIAAEMPSGTQGSMSFSMGEIKDSGGKITSQAVSYEGSNLKLGFSTRDVSEKFSHFKNLREEDRTQMAAEAGIKRTNYGLHLRTGLTDDNQTVWSGLGMTQLDGKSGSLTYTTADLDLGSVKLQADIRKMDPGFNQLSALNQEERTRMALIARRQFDPTAQASAVTAKDTSLVNREIGLNRSTCIVEVDSPHVDTWLSLSNIDSAQGGLSRQALNLAMGNLSLQFDHHSIDQTFTRIANLQAVEQAHYGNEYGMTRTNLSGSLNMSGGKLSFSSADVTDNQGASVVRRQLNFQGPKFKFKANFQDIDAEFNRLMDLADSDRKLLLSERGFRRTDYWVNYQATKNLNIDSYIYDSTSAIAGETKSQNRFKINYTPHSGPKFSAFQNDYSYISESGNLSTYSRRKLTFTDSLKLFGGLTLEALHDENARREGSADPSTTTITRTHLESDPNAATSFSADTLDIDYGDGRFEKTRGIGFKSKAWSNLSFIGSYAVTDRAAGPQENSYSYGVDWKLREDLSAALSVANVHGSTKGAQRATTFSLNGLLARRFLLFNDLKITSGINKSSVQGRQTVGDNVFKLEAGLSGGNLVLDNTDKLNPKTGTYHASRIFQFESDKDPNKWYHLTYFRQYLTTPQGSRAVKRNCSLDVRLSPKSNLTLSSFYGKEARNGSINPIGGTEFKMNHKLSDRLTLVADYTSKINELTGLEAHVKGLGVSGSLSDGTAVELYYGWCSLDKGSGSDHKNVFRIKFDRQIDSDRYLVLTAERKSGIEAGSINPYEGDTVARLDFRTVFN